MVSGLLDPRVDSMIDMIQPVNRLHPLNRGLVSWWMALPGTTGGSRLMDIMNPGPNGNHGILTNMDPATDWRPGGRPGGFGSLLFGGSNQYVDIGALSIIERLTWSAWVYSTNLGATSTIMSKRRDDIDDRGPNFNQRNSGKLNWGFRDSSGWSEWITDNVVLTVNTWRLCMVTFDSVNDPVFYVDGESVPVTGGTAKAITEHVNPLFIGAFLDSGGTPKTFWTGELDDLRVWSRVLSAPEAQDCYQLSQQRYPGLLNRIRAPRFVAAAAGGAAPFTQAIIIS